MAPDPRFYEAPEGVRLSDVVRESGGELCAGKGEERLSGVGSLEGAREGELTFCRDIRGVERGLLGRTKAIAALAPRGTSALLGGAAGLGAMGLGVVECDDVDIGWARTLGYMYPGAARGQLGDWEASGDLGEGVSAARGAIVCAGAKLGEGSVVGSGAIVGPGVELGEGATVGPGAVLQCLVAGKRFCAQSGAVVGGDGFGMAYGGEGKWRRIVQLGRVKAGDDVEVGPNTMVARGALGDTILGDGVKLDGMCMIGHNVEIGEGSLLAGGCMVGGGAKLGRGCVFGGHVGVVGHVVVGEGSRVEATSVIMNDLEGGRRYGGGLPAAPWREHGRRMLWLRSAGRGELG